MDMWHDLWTKHQKGLLFAVGMICFLIAGLVVVVSPSPARRQVNVQGADRNLTQTESRIVNEGTPIVPANEFNETRAREPEREWVLYITGAVRRPGVYSLPAESRLLQLVEAAGGLEASADPVAVNLAGFLQDGLHVHVPAKGEEPPAHLTHSMPGPAVATAGVSGGRGSLININRASAEELTALRGIGPAIAANIVEHRLRNGQFQSVDDLLHVTGIGRVRLEQLRDHVTIGP